MSTVSVVVERNRTSAGGPASLESVCRLKDPETLSLALRTLTHYEVLGAPADADLKALKDAYRTLAKQFHPDTILDPVEKRRFGAIVARVIESYSVLSHSTSRETYDRQILRSSGKTVREATRPEDINPAQFKARKLQAQGILQKARQMRIMGNPWDAARYLRGAAALDPSSAEICLELGLALKSNTRWRREAEASFRASIRLDPWKPEAYIALGDLYHEQGLSVRGAKEYKRAMWLDPGNVEAKGKLERILLGDRKAKSPMAVLKRCIMGPERNRAAAGLQLAVGAAAARK